MGLLRGVWNAFRAATDTVLPIDTNPVPRDWTHVTKVDPETSKQLPLLYPLYLQHTDAVSVGGSNDVTSANTEATFELLDYASPPAIHEPSAASHVTRETRAQAAMLAIPEVLNGDSDALVGTLGVGVEQIRTELTPELLSAKLPTWLERPLCDPLADVLTSWLLEQAVFEAYIVQNPDSAAARRAGVLADDVLTPREATQRAMAADRHLKSDVVYVEYSGTYGDEEALDLLSAVDERLTRARLWYGGGIDGREKATRVLDAGADTVVVGDVFHRIAAEEATLCADALDELGTRAEIPAVTEWVERSVDVGETSAARYLRSIPAVDRPDRLAHRYLALSVALRCVAASDAGERPTAELAADAAASVEGPDWQGYADAFPAGVDDATSFLDAVVAPRLTD